MYLEFLFLRAHSRSRVERRYWSGESLYSCTTCSNDVTVGVTGPIGSGLPQFGFPRRFAISWFPLQSQKLPARICASRNTHRFVYGKHRIVDASPHSHSRAFIAENQAFE